MNKAVKIARIVTMTFFSVYTFLICWHGAETSYLKCLKIEGVKAGESTEYKFVFDSITADALFYGISSIILLLLGVASIVFLFRSTRLFVALAGVSIVTSAVFGVCLNTQVSERMVWVSLLHRLGIYGPSAVHLYLAIKPMLAYMCILSMICYSVLFFVFHRYARLSKIEISAK